MEQKFEEEARRAESLANEKRYQHISKRLDDLFALNEQLLHPPRRPHGVVLVLYLAIVATVSIFGTLIYQNAGSAAGVYIATVAMLASGPSLSIASLWGHWGLAIWLLFLEMGTVVAGSIVLKFARY